MCASRRSRASASMCRWVLAVGRRWDEVGLLVSAVGDGTWADRSTSRSGTKLGLGRRPYHEDTSTMSGPVKGACRARYVMVTSGKKKKRYTHTFFSSILDNVSFCVCHVLVMTRCQDAVVNACAFYVIKKMIFSNATELFHGWDRYRVADMVMDARQRKRRDGEHTST